ncbi:hypothetical protein HPP92_012035 [Vanilla planifolia]|uniref:tetraacyldisaccharide 4'-kinase n=1 Tax=Vanilla planifolia TaxID=51239 RepID=A0A835R1R2_VANPL|nr:hypothetical protein HPP92_012035 [Vanilla planifolia]
MEKLRTAVSQIAATPDERLPELPIFYRFFVPILSFSSYLYRISLNLHQFLYKSTLFRRHRLPVPVISVGNLTWGGNGKTPMVEFIARFLDDLGIPPLILSRGYAGGDEAKMLRRHLLHTSAKVGVGSKEVLQLQLCLKDMVT